MQLLISVRNRGEADAAVAGGAAIVDAKEPLAGALGAVSIETFRGIVAAVAGRVPVSAALGEADSGADVEARVRTFAAAGAAFVKVGFAGVESDACVEALLRAALRGAAGSAARVIAVAYADHGDASAPTPEVIAVAASRAGVHGVLLDTAAKQGPGLRDRLTPEALSAFVSAAKHRGLAVALAGRVTASDINPLRSTGADIVGVRGAACDGGRAGTLSAARVRALAELTRPDRAAAPAERTDRPRMARLRLRV